MDDHRLLRDSNCVATMQCAHHILHLIYPSPPPSIWKT